VKNTQFSAYRALTIALAGLSFMTWRAVVQTAILPTVKDARVAVPTDARSVLQATIELSQMSAPVRSNVLYTDLL